MSGGEGRGWKNFMNCKNFATCFHLSTPRGGWGDAGGAVASKMCSTIARAQNCTAVGGTPFVVYSILHAWHRQFLANSRHINVVCGNYTARRDLDLSFSCLIYY